MNRKQIAKGKLVRRFGINIFEQPKYDKILKKKPHPPGMHGKARKAKITEYGKQLIEKQKIKFTYGVSERQLTNTSKRQKNTTVLPETTYSQYLREELTILYIELDLPSQEHTQGK